MPFFGLFGKKPIVERVGLPEAVGKDLIEWTMTPSPQGQRQFLETHLGIIRRESFAALDLMVEELGGTSKTIELAEYLEMMRQILAAVEAHGATREAVRSVYQQYLGV